MTMDYSYLLYIVPRQHGNTLYMLYICDIYYKHILFLFTLFF